jgi:hypothetical protein
MNRLRLVVAAVLLLPRLASGSPASDPAAVAAGISATLQEGQIGQALAMVEDALAAHPEHPVVALSSAQVLMAVADWPRALGLIERAVEAAPDAPEPNYMLAVWSLSQGDFTTARAATTKALELAPDYAPAHELMAELDLRDAIRRGDHGRFAEGSPEARALEIAESAAAGNWDGLLACCLDESLQSRLAETEGSVLTDLQSGFAGSHAGSPNGYAVQAALRQDNRAIVPVFVAVERHGTTESAERMRVLFDHPTLGRMVLPEERVVVEGLEVGQRADYFARVAEETRYSLDAIQLELARDDGGAWRLTDAALGLEEPPRLRLSDVLDDPSGLDESVTSAKPASGGERVEDSEIPLWVYGLGTLVFAAGVCTYIVLGERR